MVTFCFAWITVTALKRNDLKTINFETYMLLITAIADGILLWIMSVLFMSVAAIFCNSY